MNDDRPIRLKDAAEEFKIGVATLRAEAERGRLAIYRIGKRDYTTRNDIREMVLQCLVPQKVPAYISTRREANTRSVTAAASCDSAQQVLLRLRSTSRRSSQPNIDPSSARGR